MWRLSSRHSTAVEMEVVLAPALDLRYYAHLYTAICDHNMRSLTLMKNKLLRRDRQLSLEHFALRAAKAAACADFRTTFKIVKSLAGSSPKPLQSVLAKDGSLITQAELIKHRWRQHHAEVLSAVIVSSPYDACAAPDLSQNCAGGGVLDWVPSVTDVANILWSVDGSKALGPDGISARVLKAGGWVLLKHLHDIISASISQCRFPVPWRGRRLVNLHKKGDPKDCNNWRGLYVGDHAGKILSSVLAQQVLPSYVKFVGACQFGATPKMGVTLASHTLRSFLDVTRMQGLSSAVLYLDLSKAFDLAIREAILGMPEGLPEHRYLDYLRDIGLSDENIQLLVTTLREKGPALQQAGVSPVVIKLLNSLHSGAWCTLDGDDHVLSTRRGGRQGCLHGPTMFNMGYAMALSQVRQKLMSLNMCSGVRLRDNLPFWVSHSARFVPEAGKTSFHCGSLTSEVTFVDDQAFLMTATTPRRLRRVIARTLETVTSVFSNHGLNINFKQGKTELFVNFQGPSRSNSKYRAEIQAHHNTFPLPPNASADSVHVVSQYKHLGSLIDNDHRCNADTLARVNSAMCAYSPIAITVFGNPRFSVQVRLMLARSLVFSRLFQGIQAWSAVSLWSLKKLNTVYMRVLRRIAAKLRFDNSCGWSDCQVRTILNMPAVETHISQLRLGYLRQVLTSPVPQLRALLAVRDKDGLSLPWVQLVISDMRLLKSHLPFKLSALGDPSTDFGAWVHLITSYPAQWKQLVRNLASPVSVLDKHGSTPQLGSAQQNFACLECAHVNVQRTFFTQRALNMHLLTAHGRRSHIAQFIGPDNRCPVCHKTFALRYLAIAHASQSKPRSGAAVSCRQVIMSGSVERLSEEVLKPLVLEARRLRTTARRMGKSHVPAPWTAQRVRRLPPDDGDDSSQPQKRIRWTPVLCLPCDLGCQTSPGLRYW